MAFSELLKLSVKKKAHFMCCLCHNLGVETHHIIPRAEGGSDNEDNAAPLCPTCHETYGSNPTKRKFVREAKEFWFEICEKRYAADPDRLTSIEKKLDAIPTKEDIEKLYVQNSSTIVLGDLLDNVEKEIEKLPFSFVREEFVHPLIVRELLGWISDSYETLVAVNLSQANKSNRFHGEFKVREDSSHIWVDYKDPDGGYFIYSYIATSPSGVHMVECYDNGGGSGVFGNVILLAFQIDRAISFENSSEIKTRERIILKTLGSIGLGDRYSGKITYQDGLLVIGPDHGWFNLGESASQMIPIR